MLYFRALQRGLSDMPSADAEVRKKITAQAEREGWQAMHAYLAKIDPTAAARIHAHDSQRIQRALEVHALTGKNLTTWQQASGAPLLPYQFYNLALAPADRAVLHERIAQRFQTMLNEGFIEEVKKLQARGDLTLDTPAMRAVGYRQVWEYLLGNSTYDEMCARGIVATRQLAKRQLTWLRSWPDVKWFDSEAADVFEQVSTYLRISISPFLHVLGGGGG